MHGDKLLAMREAAMMDRLRAQARLDVIDELMASYQDRDTDAATGEATDPPPKADRPEPSPVSGRVGRRPKVSPAGVAAMLRDGPRALADIAHPLGIDRATARVVMERHPEWFRKTVPTNRLSPWQLTPAGMADLPG